MKRTICLLLALCCVLSLCACGASNNPVSYFKKEPSMNSVKKEFGENYDDYAPRNKDYQYYIDPSGKIYTLLYEDKPLFGYKGRYLFVDYVRTANGKEYSREEAPFLGMYWEADWFALGNDEQREKAFETIKNTLSKKYGEYNSVERGMVGNEYMWNTNDGWNITLKYGAGHGPSISMSKEKNYHKM